MTNRPQPGGQKGEEMSDTLLQVGNEIQDQAMKVRTFGGFSVTYKGNEISFGQQNESQIMHLLQLLLHFREQGVSRDLAKAELFGDREVDDVSHSIRNIIYNLRKKLRELGFAESQYVVKRSGVYYWADDIPVIEDAELFEVLFSKAMECQDVREKQELLDQTIRIYTGRFLADNEASTWTGLEAERYKAMFIQAVNALADILRQDHKYQELHELSLYATSADPFNEWEILTLESLSGLGHFDRTEQFYRETVDKYTEEFGDRKDNYVRNFINRLGMKLVIGHESLDEIQEKMRDKSPHDENRGMFCSLPVFQEIYRITERMLERSGDRIFIMLCTILDSKGNPMQNGARLDDLSERLRDAIVTSVRRTDTVTRYGKGQYLILLINTTFEDCSKVAGRINSRFMRAGQRTGVRYTVNNVIVSDYPPGKEAGNLRSKEVNLKKSS